MLPRRRWWPPWLGLSLAAVSLVLTASAGHELARDAGPVPALADERAVVVLTGVVSSEPALSQGRSGQTAVLRMTVTQVVGRGARSRVRTPVLVLGDERWAAVRWREQVRVQGRLTRAEPGEGVVALLRPMSAPTVVERAGAVARAAEHLRAGLRHSAAPLPADARGLLPALVIGDTSRTPTDLTDAMLATGMTHLSAVSGSNVAVVLAVALGLCGLLGLRRRAASAACALLVLAGFVVLARPEPSVIRAAAMGAIGLLGLSRSRRAAGIPVLAAAVLALLVIDPWLARSFGFALSTLATLGLLLFAARRGATPSAPVCLRRIRSWLGPALAIPGGGTGDVRTGRRAAAGVGQHRRGAGEPACGTPRRAGDRGRASRPRWSPGRVARGAARSCAGLGALPTLGIARVARVFAEVPGGTLPWPDGPPGAVLLAALTALVLLVGPLGWSVTARGPPGRWRRRLPRRGWPRHGADPRRHLAAGGWRLVACDVGQGDALVLAQRRRAVRSLVDAGPDPAPVDRCLSRLGVASARRGGAHPLPRRPRRRAARGHRRSRGPRRSSRARCATRRTSGEEVDGWAPRPRHTGAGALRRRPPPVGRSRGRRSGGRRGVSPRGRCPTTPAWCWPSHAGPVDALLMGDVEREAAHALLLRPPARPRRWPRSPSRSTSSRPRTTARPTSTRGSWRQCAAPVGGHQRGRGQRLRPPRAATPGGLRRNGFAVYRTDQRGDIAIVGEGPGRGGGLATPVTPRASGAGEDPRRGLGRLDERVEGRLDRRHPLEVGGGHGRGSAGGRPA